jgi:hypothetical protein
MLSYDAPHLIMGETECAFYHPSADDFNAFADAFALQGVPGTIHLWSVINVKIIRFVGHQETKEPCTVAISAFIASSIRLQKLQMA